jgi:DNA end-binding protein Ku
MAEQLIESMSGEWKPDEYHDEFRERLQAVLTRRIKEKGGTTTVEDEPAPREDAATNVVDFMSLLQKSLDAKKRTPAKKSAAVSKVVKKAAPAKKAAKATKAAGKATKSTSKPAKATKKAAKAAPTRKAG